MNEIEQILEIERIKKRQEEGIKAYRNVLASMRLNRLENNLPYDIFFDNVYIPLKLTIDTIVGGNWIDSYKALLNTQTNQIFNEQMKIQYKIMLANFIVKSGLYPEYTKQEVSASGDINL